MASFVRQLNSYGFHKVMQYESGSAKQERCGSGKYQHPFFRKGQEELLSKIKRKVSLPRIENDKIDPEELHKMLAIIHQMQGKQDMIDSTLESLKRPPMIDSTGDYNQQSAQELVDQSQTLENQCDRTGSRNKSEVRVSDLAGDQLKVQADASPMWTRMAEEIHPSNADWVLERRNRSCENQEHLEYEQATDNSGLDTEADDYSSTFSDSGHIKKRRKMNHFAVQKTEQHLHQMHNDSIKLTERVLALEEKSFRKLSEISSTLSTLASFIMNAEKSQRLSQV
nr:PREDICTED: uncharacterized protein LOC104146272 isoform X1 [Struthio camelus australis]